MPTWAVLLLIALCLAGLLLGTWLNWPGPSVGGTFAADDPALGRRTYVFCQACHGLDGRGIAGNYPPLAGSAILASDAAIGFVLGGAASGRLNGRMPAFGKQLTDAEIAAVLSFARSQWGNQAQAVTPDQVARLRSP